MTRIVEVSLFVTLLVSSVFCNQLLVRQTANGPVEGIEQTSSLGQKYYSFRGIPFAEPPITGKDPYTSEDVDRRFKAPIPLRRTWSENLNAHNFGSFCVQSMVRDEKWSLPWAATNSEDCLFVNVYVPADGAEKKTVLVYIHGGAYSVGDAGDLMYGPDFLLSEDNIVVTIQYRLGIFGFLNLGFGEYTGNMGLKDQQLAIKWVYENIEHFSGNQDEILLFGESAGGSSVGFQLLNEESRKYFNRAYLGSSSAFSHYGLSEIDHMQRMKEFSKTDDKAELIEYLKTTSSDILSTCYPFSMGGKTLTVSWVPTIESPSTEGAFIVKSPEDIYNSDKAPIIDTMLSFASKESVAFRPDLLGSTEPLIKENVEESEVELPFEGFDKNTYPREYKQALETLRAAYYTDLRNTEAIERANIDLMSDIIFGDSILKASILQAIVNNNGTDKNSHKNTFLFRFTFDAGLSLMRILHQFKFDGATHGDDLCYIFHCHMFDGFKLYDSHLEQKDTAYDVIMRMVKIITNFARTGNPSIENDTPFKNIESSSDVFCQEVSNNPKTSVTTNIKEQLRYDAWREVEQIYKSLRIVSKDCSYGSCEAQ